MRPTRRPAPTAETLEPRRLLAATISGFVFQDLDSDGVRDANDPWHNDSTPYIDVDNDGFLDADEPRAQYPPAGPSLNYVFNNLSPGTYTIRLGPIGTIFPASAEISTYWYGSYQTFPTNTTGVPSNAGHTVTVGEGDVVTGRDFGIEFAGFTASGAVWEDADRNGFRNGGEQVIPGRIVYVDADNDAVLDPDERRVLVDSSSQTYRIGLPQGTYTLRQVLPLGWAQSLPSNNGPATVTVAGSPFLRFDFGSYLAEAPRVVGRHVFYDESAFDHLPPAQSFLTASNVANDHAVAPDKQALLPGQTPSFANVTSYNKGINGIMVDLVIRPPVTVTAVASDFVFETRTAGGAWAPLGSPLIQLRRGAGVGRSDRVAITIPGGTVKNTWLRVTLRASRNNGLAADDVFYFGNLAGDTGGRAAGAVASVDALDLLRTRRATSPSAAITNPHDHNRDGHVSPVDFAIARSNLGARLLAFSSAAATPPPLPSQQEWAAEQLHALLS